ncbi:pseudouridine-5-phosphate glycosidase [Kaistia algarum]|uniref:pseudouridine-5'-phosphate glycosidase n=1 Tax=Kaistia algarum TaxID=2083279 RepID=UPI000CE77871|nr:pseudouridine-5'-phosphate glycosidase [Kaistia algarum]MCX5516040.1 pseudouridine-5'-phosphate glycosidase [Kaistia algarum]PPE77967.1 pseudouridine-5-phosphate glycosidase [Kaistia algarum]
MSLDQTLLFSDEVRAAKAEGRPIVALETTIVTHGMPYPENVETALAVERIVRAAGAVPATIAILDGKIRVGLTAEELKHLAGLQNVMKLSRADLAFALATGRPGATTVAATMIAAHLAGIRIFATGGIGGVHRGAETSFDVSADLHELAQTPVAVVCAGAKALLDIPKTLEVLETLGVPVVTAGQDELPAFWSRQSGLPSPLRLDAPAEIAGFIAKREEIGMSGGVLIANPVPAENEIPADVMREHIETAIADAERQGVRAKSVTPFVLGRLLELTAGKSLVTNIALVKNNARLAAEIAVALR